MYSNVLESRMYRRAVGSTMLESIQLNSLDIVAHNKIYKTCTLIECPLLDDSDNFVYNHMIDIFGNFLVIETVIDVQLLHYT